MPERIQRKRVAGWKMPPNTVSVTRPGKWGNPYRVFHDKESDTYDVVYVGERLELLQGWGLSKEMALELSLEKFKEGVNEGEVKKQLKGKNLACWCKVGEKCHAEILLQIANK